MRIKRMISTLMTVVLLFGCLCFAGTAQAAEETTPVPKVVVSAVNVTKNGEPDGAPTGFLEVSLLVQAKAFQTVGVVLSYNTEVLTPVDWDSTSANPLSPTDSWTTVIPTKGADAAAGKPALAKLAEPETEGAPVTRAYLYLGASSLQYQDLSEAATRLVTVRFKIAAAGAGFKPVTVPGVGNTLTDEANFTICLAPEAVANDAIPGAQAMLTLGEKLEADDADLNAEILDGYALKYYTWRSTIADYAEKGETACEVSFELAPGPSINTGSAPVVGGGDYAITFFDWDGRVIDAISAPETVSTDMQTLIASIEAKLQGSKRGYAFNGWLVVYQTNDGNGLKPRYKSLTSVKAAESTPVNYDTTPSAVNNAKLYTQDMFSNYSSLKDITTKAFEDLDNAADGSETAVLLQATYKTTIGVNNDDSKLNDGMSILDDNARYKFSDPTFYQYGKTTSAEYGFYAIRVNVSRDSTLRADKPTVQAEVFVDGSSYAVTVKVDLENTDEASFEVVVPKTVKSVAYRVLDTYGKDNWINGTSRSLVITDKCLKNTIITEGAFATIVDEARSGLITDTVNSAINKLCFDNAGFTGVTEANLNTVTANLASESARLGRTLTRNEVQSVITSGHA